MATGEPALVEFIRAQIQRGGPVSFRWFMEQALYHPQHGYYSSGRAGIGRAGDYFTNVSVGSIFGELLARQFKEIWERMERPENFTIVEQGAYDGSFACDVLRFLRRKRREFFSAVVYRIVESHSILRAQQRGTLAEFTGKVLWYDSLEKLEPFSGVHFSNELLDAMPVYLVRRKNQRWLERRVDSADNGFVFTDAEIPEALAKILPTTNEEDFETALNLDALEWSEAVAQKLRRGVVLICDYGQTSRERGRGTLAGFQKHRAIESPLIEIGHADITAHVDWTGIAAQMENCGMRFCGFADQHHFLTGLISQFVADNDSLGRGLQTILHPGLLGRTFQFLALAKGMAADTKLSGFKFGRDRRALD